MPKPSFRHSFIFVLYRRSCTQEVPFLQCLECFHPFISTQFRKLACLDSLNPVLLPVAAVVADVKTRLWRHYTAIDQTRRQTSTTSLRFPAETPPIRDIFVHLMLPKCGAIIAKPFFVAVSVVDELNRIPLTWWKQKVKLLVEGHSFKWPAIAQRIGCFPLAYK